MASTPQQQQFANDGYLRFPAFLTPTETADLLVLLHDAQARQQEQSHLDRGGMTFKHNVWRHSQPLRDFLASPKLVHALREVIGPDFWLRWDQTIEKRPGGAAFPWHQDNGYNGLLDQHYQFWIALTPMTRENGGLWLQPGSHKAGVVRHTFEDSHAFHAGDERAAVFMPAAPGDALIFSSLMLHKTDANVTKDQSRLAYVMEFMHSGDIDPFIEPPYLVIARGGEPAPALVDSQPGALSARNQLRYLWPRLQRCMRSARAAMAQVLRGKR